MLDYGPLHCFWTFLFERINKVLKSYKTSNHAGGELETSFFREFHRTLQLSRVVSLLPYSIAICNGSVPQMAAANASNNKFAADSIALMYRATSDDRGTVQGLAQELDSISEDGMSCPYSLPFHIYILFIAL